jgi:hypothetical protein
MIMGTKKLAEKLNDFFDLSDSKKNQKQEKLLKIIDKLKAKKIKLEHKMVRESGLDETSDKYQDLSKEFAAISKLIKKAKKAKKARSDNSLTENG